MKLSKLTQTSLLGPRVSKLMSLQSNFMPFCCNVQKKCLSDLIQCYFNNKETAFFTKWYLIYNFLSCKLDTIWCKMLFFLKNIPIEKVGSLY